MQELVYTRFVSKNRVAFPSSPLFRHDATSLHFVYATMTLIAEGTGRQILITAPNRKLELKNLSFFKSELAACWAELSHAVRGVPLFVNTLMVFNEVWCLKTSNLASQFKLRADIHDGHQPVSALSSKCSSEK